MKKRGLGKGLGALIPDIEKDDQSRFAYVPIGDITPNPRQPRKKFDQDQLESLAQSIKAEGVLQPVILKKKNGKYELIVGERRFRAAKMAELKQLPAIIIQAEAEKSMIIGLIENIHRQDLNPIEEAAAFRLLMDMEGLTQEKLSQKIGIDRTTISNAVRLLNLPEPVKKDVAEGKISAGHAKVLLTLKESELILMVRDEILTKELSVRDTEKFVSSLNKTPATTKKNRTRLDAQLEFIRNRLMESLQTKVAIKPKAKKGGRIIIDYYSNEDLDHILSIIEQG